MKLLISTIIFIHQVAAGRQLAGVQPTNATAAAAVDGHASQGRIASKRGPELPSGHAYGSENATSKMNIAQMVGYSLAGALEHWNGACHYGYNCGYACGPGTETYNNQWNSKMKYWDDDLDKYCWLHDWCLHNAAQSSKSKKVACDKMLEGRTKRIYNDNKICSWYQVWCVEDNYAANAWIIMKGMQAAIYFDIRD
jgi:hypothetical protein